MGLSANIETVIKGQKDNIRYAFISGDQLKSRQKSRSNFMYTINGYQNSHGISYETARKDPLQMADTYRFLKKMKDGKTFVFVSPPDLEERIDPLKK